MRTLFSISMAISLCATSIAYGTGNPTPGYPHDTLNFHVKKAASGEVHCSGGHAVFIPYDEVTGKIRDFDIYITMVDWVQLDNDEDELYDEDPINGFDDDGDGRTDEDPVEPGNLTGVLDCDAEDGHVALQIRDTEPEKGVISTQEWFIRMSGKPEENFAFWTNADQVTCLLTEDPDGEPNTGDEVVDCSYDNSDWVQLGYVDLAQYEGNCVKQVKLGGKNGGKGGGKTPFCDMTGEFEVDVDLNGDDSINPLLGEQDQYLFSISCVDVEETDVDESESCPLSRMIWGMAPMETTSKAKAQVFIGHTGYTNVKGGKIHGPGSK